jgi:hypothetical protein
MIMCFSFMEECLKDYKKILFYVMNKTLFSILNAPLTDHKKFKKKYTDMCLDLANTFL